MILKGKKKKKRFLNEMVPVFLIAVLIVLWGIKEGIFNKSENQVSHTSLSVYCGAENVKEGKFINGENKFIGAETQSDFKSRNGKYSSKLDANNKYGITYLLPHPRYYI
jgi:hypothetical protein